MQNIGMIKSPKQRLPLAQEQPKSSEDKENHADINKDNMTTMLKEEEESAGETTSECSMQFVQKIINNNLIQDNVGVPIGVNSTEGTLTTNIEQQDLLEKYRLPTQTMFTDTNHT